jgi:hypothetical protein
MTASTTEAVEIRRFEEDFGLQRRLDHRECQHCVACPAERDLIAKALDDLLDDGQARHHFFEVEEVIQL